ncbi:hypothetical protein [Parvularcula marina]|uniref:hypothetical protein n=1 Tax=Parvularcula marina TaxID=2292771 RepID=UPI0013147BBF|nr:hypothetical protein [Parvularcula marina]
MQVSQQATTRELLERLAATELRRRLTAERIFRELRKTGEERDGPTSDLSRLSPSLR